MSCLESLASGKGANWPTGQYKSTGSAWTRPLGETGIRAWVRNQEMHFLNGQSNTLHIWPRNWAWKIYSAGIWRPLESNVEHCQFKKRPFFQRFWLGKGLLIKRLSVGNGKSGECAFLSHAVECNEHTQMWMQRFLLWKITGEILWEAKNIPKYLAIFLTKFIYFYGLGEPDSLGYVKNYSFGSWWPACQ